MSHGTALLDCTEESQRNWLEWLADRREEPAEFDSFELDVGLRRYPV